MAAPELILHLTRRIDWDHARQTGWYTRSTRGAELDEVGYIHGSFADQLPDVARFLYADELAELVVLSIDPNALAEAGVTVRIEDLEGTGTAYPHIYGPLPIAAIVGVRRARFDKAGDFTLGEAIREAD